MKPFSRGSRSGDVALAGRRLRWQSMGMVVLSLGFGLCVMAFLAGLDATPWESTDAAGGTMGFNDPLSMEHYRIILSNISGHGTLRMGVYELVFVGMHGLALFLLAGVRQEKWMIRFCLFQPLAFPWGVVGLLALPLTAVDIVRSRPWDREGFTDVPFVPIVAGGFWLWVVAAIAWRLHRFRKRLRQSPLLGEAPEPARPVQT